MLSLLGLIPGMMTLITNVMAKVSDNKTKIVMQQLGVDRDTAVARIQAQAAAGHDRVAALQIIAANPLLTGLVLAFAFPLVMYFWKVVGWDITIGSMFGCYGKTAAGTCTMFQTDGIMDHNVGDWASAIIYSLFGSATGMGAAAIFSAKGK